MLRRKESDSGFGRAPIHIVVGGRYAEDVVARSEQRVCGQTRPAGVYLGAFAVGVLLPIAGDRME